MAKLGMNNLINILKRKDVLLLIFVLVLGLLGFLDGMWLAHNPRSNPYYDTPWNSSKSTGISLILHILMFVVFIVSLVLGFWEMIKMWWYLFKRSWSLLKSTIVSALIYLFVLRSAAFFSGFSEIYGEAYTYSNTPKLCGQAGVGALVIVCDGDVVRLLNSEGLLMYDPGDEMKLPATQWSNTFMKAIESEPDIKDVKTVIHRSDCQFSDIKRVYGHVYFMSYDRCEIG